MDKEKSTDINVDGSLRERLEMVRKQQGFQTIDQAMTFLVRSRIRRNGDQLFGRGRALHIVKG